VHLAARPVLADAVAAALLATPSRVVFVAEHLRDRLLSMCSFTRRSLTERSLSCPMGIDATPQQRIARSKRPIVAFVGRLVPIKGADVLLAAARALPDTTFIVAGDGPERARLTRSAAPNVILPGELRGPARDALYGSAHALVVPSRELPSGRTEGAPTVIVEAFAAGVPVIASDLPATRELAGSLRLVPPGDPEALVAAIRETLAGGLAVSTRVARGRKRAAARDWSIIGQRLLDVWLAI
jgi:glycosyltransferase involved in cell wall biosynthesis